MGEGGPGAGLRPPHVDGGDRLGLDQAPRRADEFTGPPDTLDIQANGGHVVLIDQVFEAVGQVQVGLVAHADGLVDAGAHLAPQLVGLAGIGAGLGGEGDTPPAGSVTEGSGVQGGIVAEDTDAVGADETDPILAGHLHQAFLQPSALPSRYLPESPRDDHGALDARLPQVLQGLGDHLGGKNQDGHIHGMGYLLGPGIGLEVHDLFLSQVYGVNGSLEIRSQKVGHENRPHLQYVVGRAVKGQGARVHYLM